MEPLGKIFRGIAGNGTTAQARPRSTAEQTSPDTCPLCHGLGYVRVTPDSDHPDVERYDRCECQERQFREHRRQILIEQSQLGPLARKTFANLKQEGRRSRNPERYRAVVDVAKEYAENPAGWLVIGGVAGCGKTHLAAAIANVLIDRGDSVLFQIVADLLDHLRTAYAPNAEARFDEMFDQLSKVPLLILDDFGGQSNTPWAQEKLFQIINRRFNAELPTVFTLAMSVDELDERIRVRLTDPDIATLCVLEEPGSPLYQRIGVLSLDLLKSMSFDNFELRNDLDADKRAVLQAAVKAARAFAEQPDGWLVFTGSCGTGKTHLAAAVANARLARQEPVFFAVVPDLLDHLRSTFAPDSRVTYDELFETLRSTPLLILDDLGAHSSSVWAEEKLYQVVNYRYNARLPTVFTTNHEPDDLDPRLMSRMVDKQLSTVFPINLPDYRADTPSRRPEPRRGAARKR